MQHSYGIQDITKSVDRHDSAGSASQYRVYIQRPVDGRNTGVPDAVESLKKNVEDDEQILSPSKLRAKLRAELEQRAKSCLHSGYKCSRPPATPASDYCALHILQATGGSDPALIHYTRCAHIYSLNGRRCPNAAPKRRSLQGTLDPISSARLPHQQQNQSYCFEHSRLAQRSRTKQVSRRRAFSGLDSMLSGLSHYLVKSTELTRFIIKDKNINANEYHSSHWSIVTRETDTDKEGEIHVKWNENGKIIPLDPITDIDPEQVDKLRNPTQYASSTDSEDEDAILYGDVEQGVGFLGSDDECLDDFTGFDPLKHASIYTAIEANMILCDKLSRLQELYVDQFKILQQELKIKKMKLAPAVKREQETLCSVQNQPKDTTKEFNIYHKLKAYKRYNKKSGFEAILHDRSLERTAKYMASHSKISFNKPYGNHNGSQATGPKCIFSEGGIKCTGRSMPCTKFCQKHILHDKRQILFKPCAVEIGGVCCKEPITGILEIDSCSLHFKISEPRTYSIRKEDSDSENFDDDLDEQDKSIRRRLSSENDSNFQDSPVFNKFERKVDMEFSIFENGSNEHLPAMEADTFMSIGEEMSVKIDDNGSISSDELNVDIIDQNTVDRTDVSHQNCSKVGANLSMNKVLNEPVVGTNILFKDQDEQFLYQSIEADYCKLSKNSVKDRIFESQAGGDINIANKSLSSIIEPISEEFEIESA